MRRSALVSCVLISLAIPIAAAEGVMRARATAKKRVDARVFDTRWTLPRLRVSESDRRPPNRVDLLREMKSMATRTFPMRKGERKLRWTRSFGDVIRGLREAKDDPDRRARMLRILRRGRPSVWRAIGAYLPQLVNDDRLYSDGWDPDDDEDDDGVLHVEPFDHTTSNQAPWNRLSGTSDVHQAATLVYADLEAIKASENDFAGYRTQVGSDYDEVWGVAKSYVRGVDESRGPYTVVRMWFVTDLDFPYSTCSADVRIRTTLDEDGHLCTDIYGTGDDVYWLAGQDVVIPVHASDGEFVACLLVRVYGFDIRSVPDGDGARSGAIRGLLGNVRLRAERYFHEYGGAPRTLKGKIPEFVVRGVGPAPEDR